MFLQNTYFNKKSQALIYVFLRKKSVKLLNEKVIEVLKWAQDGGARPIPTFCPYCRSLILFLSL